MIITRQDEVICILEKLQSELIAKGLTLATAESCTGGMLSMLLTHLPGSSEVFLGGFSTYSNESKVKLLGVSEKSLNLSGAVSEQVAREMAIQCQKLLNSSIAVSITGIAGPGGAVVGKPVGTIFTALASDHSCQVERHQLSGNRVDNRSEICLIILKRIMSYVNSI